MSRSLINIPSFLRTALEGNRAITLTGAEIGENNFSSTGSFMYDSSTMPLKSTQQLNIDWENFENHTFFAPATINVNSAFDKIINGFPFDGTRIELERFLENLTGYEYWVLEQFPKYRGQLHFSGGLQNYVTVYDTPGAMFSELARSTNDGIGLISPRAGESLTIECQYFPPAAANLSQYICYMSSLGNEGHVGFSLGMIANVSPSTADLVFTVSSGSYSLQVTGSVVKGQFNHVLAEFDNTGAGNQFVRLTVGSGSTKLSNSESTFINALNVENLPMYIGSGSAMLTFTPTQTLSGVLDEFRIFKDIRTQTEIENFQARSIFADDNLTLYLKFNEPAPPIIPTTTADAATLEAICLDSSGNSLHATMANFTDELRINASGSVYGDPMYLERELFCPILFPAHTDVVALNTELLLSASAYDAENPNIITRLVPRHYFYEGQAEQGLSTVDGSIIDTYVGTSIPGTGKLGTAQLFMSLLYVYARFFDEIKLFIDAFSSIQYVDYDRIGTVPDTFLQNLLVQKGFVIPPIFSHSTIEQYVDSENLQYPVSAGTHSLKYVQNELIRRLLVNLPAIIRSKGTQHGIKAFLRSLGIDPENSCRIREYGGPTRQTLGLARDFKTQIASVVTFEQTTLAVSKFLSASRLEVGYPEPRGSMVLIDDFPPHGISNRTDDGLLTSGSFTVETIVQFPLSRTGSSSGVDSIVRMCMTGSGVMVNGLAANLIAESGSSYITLYARPGTATTSPLLTLNLTGTTVYDGDKWNVSFGRMRGDDGGMTTVSSSYFVRAAKTCGGSIVSYNTTSSFLEENSDAFSQYVATFNNSGSCLAVGTNQTFGVGAAAGYRMLNNTLASPTNSREVIFTGRESNLRFWSKALSDTEWKEHVRNFKSVGTIDPLVNYNFTHTPSGSFERLRLDTFSKQPIVTADTVGSITFLDFSGNEFNMSGSGYTAGSSVIIPNVFDVSYMSPIIDEPTTNEKVRPRSFMSQTNIDENPGSTLAPSYDIETSEIPQDDVRLSIEFSLIDALNRDIVTIFSTLEALDNALGDPSLMFSSDYPDLDRLRDLYFNRLSEKLNFKAFHEFFKFFDVSISTFIEQIIPKKTKFKGVNFIIESHMLERHKLEYYSSEIYLVDSQRSTIKNSLVEPTTLLGVFKKH